MPNPRKGLARPPAPRENGKRSQQQTLPHISKRKNTLGLRTRQRLRHTMLGRHQPTNYINPRTRKKRQRHELLHTPNHIQNLQLLRRRQNPHVHPRPQRIHNAKRKEHRPHNRHSPPNTHTKIRTPRLRHRRRTATLQMSMVRHRLGLERTRRSLHAARPPNLSRNMAHSRHESTTPTHPTQTNTRSKLNTRLSYCPRRQHQVRTRNTHE
jgi:hypothetical protein